MRRIEQLNDIFNQIVDLEATLGHPEISAPEQQVLREQQRSLLQKLLDHPTLPTSERQRVEQMLNMVKQGIAINNASNNTFHLHFYNQLPETDQRLLTSWIDRWVRDELGLLPHIDDMHHDLAANLVASTMLRERAVSEFQGISDIIHTFPPIKLSAFYAALDRTFILSEIEWMDVAVLQQILWQAEIPDNVIRMAYRIAHPSKEPINTDHNHIMVYRLAQQCCENTHQSLLQHPLCTFVSYILEGICEQPGKDNLCDWLIQMKKDRGVVPRVKDLHHQPQITTASIVIAVEEILQPSVDVPQMPACPELICSHPIVYLPDLANQHTKQYFQIVAWTCDDDGTILSFCPTITVENCPARDLLYHISSTIVQVKKSIYDSQPTPPTITIEFDISPKWIRYEMEYVPSDPERLQSKPIAFDDSVVVRTYRHLTKTQQMRVKQKWQTLQDAVSSAQGIHICLLKEYQNEIHLTRQVHGFLITMITFLCDIHTLEAVLQAVLDVGIPLALCPRPAFVGSLREKSVCLKDLLIVDHPKHILEAVRQERLSGYLAEDPQHIGNHLLLLWNNPHRPHPIHDAGLIYE